jgi:hypothetical protein
MVRCLAARVPNVNARSGGAPPRWAAALVVAATLFGLAQTAWAHGLGMSQISLRIGGRRALGTWQVQLADLAAVLPLAPRLDTSGSIDAAWREVQAHEAEVRRYVADRFALSADAATCIPEAAPAPMRWDPGQNLVIIDVGAKCPIEPSKLTVRCDLLFDQNAKHRVYFSIEDDRVTHLGIFRQDARQATIDVRYFHFAEGFLEFVREGIWHIWSGPDHILFLLALLLPAPLARGRDGWSPRSELAATAREALKVVTAFTIAHSVTLCLSFFGIITLPARWVEAGIALSVFAAAWNNLRPFLPARGWTMAFGFGLLHGLGFAGALRNLSLPHHARALALAAFNVGVEMGQLAIVAAVLPLFYVASRRRAYPRFVMGLGSLGVAWIAALWTLERAFGLSLLAGRGWGG